MVENKLSTTNTMTPQPKQEIQIPTEERLRLLLANNMVVVAQGLIDQHKLPYRIEKVERTEGYVGPDYDLKASLKGSEIHLRQFITNDPELLMMKDDLMKLAKCPHEVLITGETGTGKELVARALRGDREGKFVAVNCAGLPENLIESELFGHVKGAFTGADSGRAGLFKVADDGALFLDEIGELPMSMQGKLLRTLQDKMVRRVGGKEEEPINCKFICATNKNVKRMVEQGTFRQDLYARISTFEIHLKPLIERRGDITSIINSLVGGQQFLRALLESGKTIHDLNLSLNVRSLQQYVTRFNVLGRIVL